MSDEHHDMPKGAIIAWYGTSGSIPHGWAICDGANGTPNLIGKFLRGAASIGQVGHSGGTDQNSITVAEDGRKGSDYHWGNTPWSSGHNPATGGQTFTIDNRPAFTEILFLMKL